LNDACLLGKNIFNYFSFFFDFKIGKAINNRIKFNKMLKLKSQLTCSYCSKIYKDPIDLSCDDSICREHLTARDVVKANKIVCNECKQEFQVKENEFKSNKSFKKLIESQSYLSEEEMSLKKELEVSIRNYFEFYEKFIQNKSKLNMDVYNHFQEMRFQIDEHREELKKRIDEIALEMIDEIKKCEEIYLKNHKESFSLFYETQSVEDKLKEIEDTFRQPNLLIQTIKEMQQKQEESLRDIIEMSKIKDNLKATNDFKPNKSSFDQTETSLFGSIKLNGCWLNINSFENSQILTDLKQSFESIRLCEFSPNDKWSLLYRGTRDGFGSHVFHSKCNGHANTLTILKAKGSSYIFGGYTTVSWQSSAFGKWESDANAFIFSLTNKDNQPIKMKIDPNGHHRAIYCHSDNGPTFGSGHDIYIANNANKTWNSYSDLGRTYRHPQYEEGTIEALRFLVGSHKFQLDEIEVYQKE
jgi:hypothetical protein